MSELSEEDFALEACQQGGFESLDAARDFVRRIRDSERRRCAQLARDRWPRGSAHTYASENADRYRALEDASEAIARAIEGGSDADKR